MTFFVQSRSRRSVSYEMAYTPEGYAVHLDEGCEGEIFNGPLGCWHSKQHTVLQEDIEDMTTAVTPYQGGAVTEAREFTPEDIETLKSTICKGATDSELKLFIATCQHTGLDPFMRQIHAVKRWDSNEKREVMAIQVGIDGYRLTARRTGEMQGMDGPYWTYDGETWVDLPREDVMPRAARVIIYRKGVERGFPAIARWSAYVQTNREGKPNAMWSRMGPEQLAKCAEALALRRAFPAELAALPQHVEYDESTDYGDDWTPEQVRDHYIAEHGNVVDSGYTPPALDTAAPEPPLAQDNPEQDDEPVEQAALATDEQLAQMGEWSQAMKDHKDGRAMVTELARVRVERWAYAVNGENKFESKRLTQADAEDFIKLMADIVEGRHVAPTEAQPALVT